MIITGAMASPDTNIIHSTNSWCIQLWNFLLLGDGISQALEHLQRGISHIARTIGGGSGSGNSESGVDWWELESSRSGGGQQH